MLKAIQPVLKTVDAFDTWALRKILRISYFRRISNAEVRAVSTSFQHGNGVTLEILWLHCVHSVSNEDHHHTDSAVICKPHGTGNNPRKTQSYMAQSH